MACLGGRWFLRVGVNRIGVNIGAVLALAMGQMVAAAPKAPPVPPPKAPPVQPGQVQIRINITVTSRPGPANAVAPKPKIEKPQSAAEEQKCFVLPAGFEIELVASEPAVINPVTLMLDGQGRLHASESHTYRYGPAGTPVKPFTNPIVRLDRAATGNDPPTRTIVAEGFNDPVMGMTTRGRQLWVTANNLLYRYDLDDAGKAVNRQ